MTEHNSIFSKNFYLATQSCLTIFLVNSGAQRYETVATI
jgi:hypothetical protein